MTKDDIIKMAQEAGLSDFGGCTEQNIERFAAFVAAKAAEKEREVCIKDADDQWVKNPNYSGGDAIRKRANKHET